ncbi:MAG: TonB-dependent receptor [Parvularculaceae bacterium]
MAKFRNTTAARALIVAGAAASASIAPSTSALAQGARSDEIVVQATRRETSLQQTPVAVSALNDEAVDAIVPRDLGDIATLVPNFSASKITGFNAASFAIRGAAQTDIIVYSEPQVGVTLDDFVVPSVQTQLLDLFDIEQVEVLRGPQGTLFGKNTTAGVVNVRTKRPEIGVVSGSGRLQAGSFGQVQTRLALNLPIGDQLAFRFSGQYQRSNGFYRNGAEFGPVAPFGPVVDGAVVNPFTGASGVGDGGRLGGEDVGNFRAKLLWQPSDNFEALLQYEFLRDNSETVPAVNETPSDPASGFLFPLLGFTEDQGDPLNNAGVTDPDAIGADIGLFDGHQVDVNGYYLNLNWDVSDVLSVVSVTGFRAQDSRLVNNYVGEVGPVSLFDANRADDRETFQQEVRVNWNVTDSLDVVAGGFFQSNDTTFCVTQTLGFLDLFGVELPFGLFNDNPQVLCNAQDADAYADFADGTYQLTDRLQLSGGVRWTWEEKDFIGRNQVFFQTLEGGFDPNLSFATLGPLGAADFERFNIGVAESSATFSEPSWRAVASYEFTEDLFGYVNISRSFRSGAFNDQSGTTGNELTPELIAATDPETVISYEAGLRTTWLDGALTFNPTFFFAQFDDAQRQVAATLVNSFGQEFQETRFFNAAEVEIYGVELEANWITPIEGLTLGGNFAWQEGEFVSFAADTDFDGEIDVDFSDRDLNRTPEIAWTVFGRYETPIADNKVMRLNATAGFEDDQIFAFSDLGEACDSTLNSRTLVSATVEIADIDDKWFARFFGRNLLDERYRVSSQPVANLWIFSQYGEPRAFGVEVGFNFHSDN